MEWYIPITILPSVGVLILSTTNQMLALSGEVNMLLSNRSTAMQHRIADLKIKQLGRLTRAAMLLYVSAACFVLAGIAGAVLPVSWSGRAAELILILGVLLVLMALILLVVYGMRLIAIRKLQHEHNHEMDA